MKKLLLASAVLILCGCDESNIKKNFIKATSDNCYQNIQTNNTLVAKRAYCDCGAKYIASEYSDEQIIEMELNPEKYEQGLIKISSKAVAKCAKHLED